MWGGCSTGDGIVGLVDVSVGRYGICTGVNIGDLGHRPSARVTGASGTITSGGRGCLVSVYLNGRPFGGGSGPGATCSNRCVETLRGDMV